MTKIKDDNSGQKQESPDKADNTPEDKPDSIDPKGDNSEETADKPAKKDKKSEENQENSKEKKDNSVVEIVGEESDPELSKELKLYEQQNIAKLGEYVQSAQTYENYLIKRTKTRARRSAIRFFLFVILTTAIAVYYYGFVASDRYVSTFQFTVESSKQSSPSLLQGLMLGQVGGHSTDKDTNVLSEYLKSPVLLDKLDSWLGIKAHFQQKNIDYFSRLPADASREDFLEYFRNFLEIDIKTTPNVVSVSVQAFDPEVAAAIGQSMVTLSEELINSINEQIVEDSLRIAKLDLSKAETRLNNVQEKAQSFQIEEEDLDPEKSADVILQITAMLEGQLAVLRSNLTEIQTYMQPDAVQVVTLKTKIRALEQQIQREKSKLTNSQKSDEKTYPEKLGDFARIQLEAEFARKAYEASFASYEMAKSEAVRKMSYVVAFVPASIPESPGEPQRLIAILTVFVVAATGYMLLSFLMATIRDHIDT